MFSGDTVPLQEGRTSGRFLSEDPARLAAGDINLSRYVFNNPVSAVDPSGQKCDGFFSCISAGIGAVGDAIGSTIYNGVRAVAGETVANGLTDVAVAADPIVAGIADSATFGGITSVREKEFSDIALIKQSHNSTYIFNFTKIQRETSFK